MVNKACLLFSPYLRLIHLKTKVHRISQQFSSLADSHNKLEEGKVRVDGVDINYVRVGTGEHPVLLLPGAIGSVWTDFKPQIEHLDRTKFTVIAWDPPGYGMSRPPNRTFPNNFYHQDATWASNLMQSLGYRKFSLIGWSDGGITSLILAAKYPRNVKRIVALAANAYVTAEESQMYKSYRSIESWSEKMRAPMIQVYGEEYFRKTWSDWVDALIRIYQEQKGNLCKELLPNIECPTLIIQGTKDAMVLPEHAQYLEKHIAHSKLHIFEGGAHNLHLRYPAEFNKLVTQFLTGATPRPQVNTEVCRG